MVGVSTLPGDDPVPQSPVPQSPAPQSPARGVPVTYRAASARPLPVEDDIIPWPVPRPVARRGSVRPAPTRPVARATRRRSSRAPATGLPGVIVFALLGAFFGWVSAQPAWLALGHGTAASAAVTACTGHGLGRSCRVNVTGAGLDAADLRLVGADARVGERVPVRVVNASARVAYAGSSAGLARRAVLGLVLVLACGLGAAWASGARRLAGRARTVAVPASFAVPVALALALLAAAW